MDFSLTPEQQKVLKFARDFTRAEVVPVLPRGCLGKSLAYALERRQFGQRPSSFLPAQAKQSNMA